MYQKRYEEGYDLPDPDYKKWLDINHPCNDDSASSKITHASGFKHADAESSSDILSEVLKFPEPKPSIRKRRGINSKAIHLTDGDFLNELKDKEEEKKTKEAEKQSKKEEREKRRVEREKRKAEYPRKREATAKKGKYHGKPRSCRGKASIEAKLKKLTIDQSSNDSSTDSESSAESDAQCPVCGLTYLGDDSHAVWVSCDVCSSWLDFKCTGLKNPNRLPKKYLCPDCK